MEALDRIIGTQQGRRRRVPSSLTLLAGMSAFLALAEAYNGAVSSTVERAKKALAVFLQGVADGQAGVRLWAPTEPPQQLEHAFSWKLPSRGDKRRAAGARGSASGDSPAEGLARKPPLSDGSQQDGCTQGDADNNRSSRSSSSKDDPFANDAPTFFMSTKLFGCLDLEESQELYRLTKRVVLQPQEVLFLAGDSGDSGMFIVVEGELGVFLSQAAGDPSSKVTASRVHTNTLREGESIGDLDVIDGAFRSVTCTALDSRAVLLQVTRRVFLSFVASHPRVLLLYLSQALARLWRVAHFVLSDFLSIPISSSGAQRSGTNSAGPLSGSSRSSAPDPGSGTQDEESTKHEAPDTTKAKAGGGKAAQAERGATASLTSLRRKRPSISSVGDTFKWLQQLEGPACMRNASRRANFTYATTANLAGGWDVVPVEDTMFSSSTWQILRSPPGQNPAAVRLLSHGEQINRNAESPCSCFYVVVQGHLLSERASGLSERDSKPESAVVSPGSLIGGAAFLAHTPQHTTIRAAEPCVLVGLGHAELERLLATRPQAYLEVLLTAGKALGPTIRRFLTLGLNRVWLNAGDYAFRQGEPANCLFINISGRMQSLHLEQSGGDSPREQAEVLEMEWGRGEVIGGLELAAGSVHQSSARAVRDCELVRMSRGSFRLILTQSLVAVQSMARATVASVRGMRQRERKLGAPSSAAEEVVTIAIMPAGVPMATRMADGESSPGSGLAKPAASPPTAACRKLKEAFQAWGPVLHLNRESMQLSFPTAFDRLHSVFYRSKITSWMAQQEEEFRFILLETDANLTAWSRLCVSQADCVLLVAATDCNPELGELEDALLWHNSDRSGSKRPRRIELVLSHISDAPPQGTARWLAPRPHLRRHHHIRMHNPKDTARLARWMSGRALGLVLSGGGSRGLAHLGVLRALDDAGLEVDVVGGTSQGAFMAALYAQGLTWDLMLNQVRQYAQQLGSVRHLFSDLTLPLLSLFSGSGFDRLVKEALSHGPQRIEDTWLQYFCITTNLNQGVATNHLRGDLATLVRASMTIVGLVPPVCHEEELHVDGGYLNNIPVAEMYNLGVGSCIVVDVEDKEGIWGTLQSYDGGVSGWKLLWDRWCPLPSLQFGYTMMPRYNQLINALTWMGHSQNIRRVRKDFHIDLYLRPPGIQHYKLMDYALMDRIVRDAYRYGWTAITEWSVQQSLSNAAAKQQQPGQPKQTHQPPTGASWAPPVPSGPSRMNRAHSLACMSQLQKKQAWMLDDAGPGAEGPGGSGSAATAGSGTEGSRDHSPSAAWTGSWLSWLQGGVQGRADAAAGVPGAGAAGGVASSGQPPSEAGCSNVMPLFNIPEAASVQDHPAEVSQALTQNGRRKPPGGFQQHAGLEPRLQSIAPGFAFTSGGRPANAVHPSPVHPNRLEALPEAVRKQHRHRRHKSAEVAADRDHQDIGFRTDDPAEVGLDQDQEPYTQLADRSIGAGRRRPSPQRRMSFEEQLRAAVAAAEASKHKAKLQSESRSSGQRGRGEEGSLGKGLTRQPSAHSATLVAAEPLPPLAAVSVSGRSASAPSSMAQLHELVTDFL